MPIGALIVILVPVSLMVGVVSASPLDVWHAFTAFDSSNTTQLLVRELRVPRTVLAVLVGAGLGTAGVVMQAITRNPLAEPGLLGVNAGATFTVAVGVAVFGLGSVAVSMVFGFFGAALAGAAVYLLGGAGRGAGPVRLVLAGAALSVVLLAATRIMLVNADEQLFDRFRTWVVGSLEGRGTQVLLPTAGAVIAGMLLALSIAKALDASVLGADFSRTLGANPRLLMTVAAGAIIVLCGACAAAAGPIGFVGMTAPFLARTLVGVNHRTLIPATALIAAAVVLAADVAGRVVVPNGEIGVGIMTAMLGAPIFIYVVRQRKIARL